MPGLGRALFAATFLVATAFVAAPGSAQVGPDVIVSGLGSFESHGVSFNLGGYSFATTSCNVGDTDAAWFEFTEQHPVIAQNAYRLLDGRFEQIGMSWLKHAFCALDQDDCGVCQANGNCDLLGVGCADTYGAVINGDQTGLGPRSEVNPSTGFLVYPFGDQGVTGNDAYKRIQISNFDLSPTFNAGAKFFYEGQYVHFEEPAFGNQFNNVSHREFNVGTFSNGYNLNPTGPTFAEEPAILAWQREVPSVEIAVIDIPMDGRYYLAGDVIDNGNGSWRYEYALYNMNSDRAVRAFEVSVPPGALVASLQFTDVDSHSGEPYSTLDWPGVTLADRVSWETGEFITDLNANALRWGTMYSFGFTTDAPPAISDVSFELFKPGSDMFQTVQMVGPGFGCVPFVRGDTNGDGQFGLPDVIHLLAYLFTNGPAPIPNVDAGDVNNDQQEGLPDVIALLSFLFANGPAPAAPYPTPGCP